MNHWIFAGSSIRPKYIRIINVLNDYICSSSNVTLEQLKGKSRKRNIVQARQLCMYMLNRNTRMTSAEIAGIYNKDRTTALHSVKCIKNDMLHDSDLMNYTIELKRELAYYRNRSKFNR